MSKIPFSIEYRPLIESGEYKVEIGREDPWPARIVCWDLNGDNIIAVVMNPEGREEGLIYTKQGKHNAICPRIDSDLFIIIPEPIEWSEEDEKLIEEVCCCLCEYAGLYKGRDMEAVNNHLFKLSQRLKSLRPQPKEQDVEKIQALKAVLENRLNLLHKAIETSKKNKTHLTTKWLDGKECGYSDVLELLNSRPESIRIEL